MKPEVTPKPHDAAEDMLGWYRATTNSEPLRVRVVLADWRTLDLLTLSGRLIARWSLDRLENRAVPVIGETWAVGDSQLPERVLELENDSDYRAIQKVSRGLRSIRARWWHVLAFSVVESKMAGGALLLLGIVAVSWLWQNLPFAQCIATHPDGILFLKCLLFDHFMR